MFFVAPMIPLLRGATLDYLVHRNRTDLELALWLGSHGAAAALQATLGAAASLTFAYLSFEPFEKPLLCLKRLFETAEACGPFWELGTTGLGRVQGVGGISWKTGGRVRPIARQIGSMVGPGRYAGGPGGHPVRPRSR